MKRSFTKYADPSSRGKLHIVKQCRHFLLMMALLMFCCVAAMAQQKVVTGVVTDSGGQPLPGVSILVKGTNIGAPTNADGKFTIKVPTSSSILVFSFIGFTPLEIVVGTQTNISVKLKDSGGSNLNEVVVVGYGTTTKKDNTGSVGVISMSDVNKAPVTSIDQALEGRIAGVQVTSPDGQPGASPEINIRGTGSISNSSAPLYVVDGFPQESNPFAFLSPEDVQSITVLKDASSTAIYGARGSNGVVVITTKRGTTGAPKVSYSAYGGFQKMTKEMQMMDAYHFVKLQLDLGTTAPQYASEIYLSNGRTLDYYRNVPTIDWQSIVFRAAPFQNHNISLSGQSGKTNYYISGNYVDQSGLMVASGFNRYQGRVSLDQQLNDNLKIGLTANYAATKAYGNQPSTQSQGISGTTGTSSSPQFNLMFGVWGFPPINGSGDLNALLNNFSDDEQSNTDVDRVNPYLAALNTLNNTYNNDLNTNVYAELKLGKNFLLRSTAGIHTTSTYNEFFNNEFTRAGSPTTAQGASSGYSGGVSNGYTSSFLNENTLTYTKVFNKKHNVNILAGFTDQTQNTRSNSFNELHVPNENLGVSGIEEGTLNGSSASSSANTIATFLGRANYNYKEKYFFTTSFRADGSSKFFPGHKWGFFPSVGLAWRISEEPFMQKVPVLSDTKLRVSYGSTGNNRVSDFAYASQIGVAAGYYTFNNGIVSGAVPKGLLNTDLNWETATQLDIGLETSILQNRFQLEVDYYKKKTSNLLLAANLPQSIGYSSVTQNIGDIQNEGLEISLTSSNIRRKNFTWSTSFNISFNRNKVLALSQGAQTRLEGSANSSFGTDYQNLPGAYIAQVGKPIALFYGYVSDGIYRYADFDKIIQGNTIVYKLKPGIPYYGANPATVQPGDPKVKDLNGDGATTVDDATVIGNPYPIHFGGISNNFTYKNFDLNVFFQWSYGNQILNGNDAVFMGSTTGDARFLGVNMFAKYEDYWTPTNDGAQYAKPNANVSNVRAIQSRLIQDGSYLRLKTAQIGYTVPKKLVSRIGLSSLRFYASGQNLWVWTNYDGSDPEVNTKASPTTPGFDYSPYPRAKVYVFGLNVSL